MNRGSEWRKWDLHIHTPETAKNNQFGDPQIAWPKYIQTLEKSDISVFGITDYFSITNYLKVKDFKSKGRLENKEILPNVEMRIAPVTGNGKPINIHAIFDPTLTEDELNREFFREIKFEYKERTYSCIKEDLIELGRVIKDDKNLQIEAAIKEAIAAFAVSYEALRKIVNKSFFKNRIIIALSNSSNDGISGLLKQEVGLRPIKNEICRMADIILSGNPKDIEYFLGKKTSPEEVIENCGNLKPCITGSDAHTLDKIGIFPENRFTWIKADPTFEGLKQILFEPEERVRISDSQPDDKYDYNVIERVELNTAGVWHQTIYLNQNLNTIIGGRSTGKSTLLSSIAIKFDETISVENDSFIRQLGDNVHVYWRDGQENNQKSIEYFPHLLNALQQDVKSRQTLLPVNYLIAINGCCLIVFSLSPTLFLDYNWLKAIKFTFVFLSFTKLFEVIQHLHRFGSRPPIPALIIRNIKIHFRHGMYIFQFNRIFIHFHRILLDYTKITHLLIPNK